MTADTVKSNARCIGGRVTAVLNRRKAIQAYMAEPNVCLWCGSVIMVGVDQKVKEVRKKKFCDHSCSSKYSNTHRRRKERPTLPCERCGQDVPCRRYESDQSYHPRKYCESCRKPAQQERWQEGRQRSKAEGRPRFNSWQSYRNYIRIDAVKIYRRSGKPWVCAVCGYDTHVNVCHKVAVADFDETATTAEINAINNLVALCPNHHWEYDHGHLDADALPRTGTVFVIECDNK